MVPFWSPHGAIYAVSTHCYSFSSLISSCPRHASKLQNRQGEIQIPIDRKDSLLCKELPGHIDTSTCNLLYKRIGERKNTGFLNSRNAMGCQNDVCSLSLSLSVSSGKRCQKKCLVFWGNRHLLLALGNARQNYAILDHFQRLGSTNDRSTGRRSIHTTFHYGLL